MKDVSHSAALGYFLRAGQRSKSVDSPAADPRETYAPSCSTFEAWQNSVEPTLPLHRLQALATEMTRDFFR